MGPSAVFVHHKKCYVPVVYCFHLTVHTLNIFCICKNQHTIFQIYVRQRSIKNEIINKRHFFKLCSRTMNYCSTRTLNCQYTGSNK